MKYLKKFNESKYSDFYNDIQDCFIDFIDRDSAYLENENDHIILSFFIEEMPKSPNISVSNLKKFYQENLSIISEVEVGFKRLRDIYPNFHYESKFYGSELYFEIYENIEEGDFYKRTGDLIILDYDKIKDILKLDKEVKFSHSSDGSFDYLSINFETLNHYMKNVYRGNFPNTNDMLIFDINHHNLDMMRLSSDFDKLVIDGKKLLDRIRYVKIGREISLRLNKDLNIT
jgi:hypothetical protein